MTFDAADLLGGGGIGIALIRIRAAVRPRREVAGWATVELDRAEATFGVARRAVSTTRVGTSDGGVDAREELLGALARLIRTVDDREIALLEPFTEGRLAAALARHGEGFVALYLITDPGALVQARAAGFVLSAPSPGPFGRQHVVLGGPRWGPFIVLAGPD